MRILFCNISLATRSGTEMFLWDFIKILRQAGHETAVFTKQPGPLAEALEHLGSKVIWDIRDVPWQPDILHCHHTWETLFLLQRYPGTPALYVCHDRKAWFDSPPPSPQIQVYVAVDEYCRERIVEEAGVPKLQVRVIHNSVDLERFKPRGMLPERPRKALLFSSYGEETGFREIIRAVCAERNILLEEAGPNVGNILEKPESTLGNYDIVFGKARCALEALACGSAVILAGPEGFGPLVTRDLFLELRRFNFGRSLLGAGIDRSWLERELDRYDVHDAQRVCELTRATAGLVQMAERYICLYKELAAAPGIRNGSTGLSAGYVERLIEGITTHTRHLMNENNRLNREIVASRKPASPSLPSVAKDHIKWPETSQIETRVEKMPAPQPASRELCFHRPFAVIGGAPRSGTTLLRMMLDAHPDVAIPPETGWLSAWARQLEKTYENEWHFLYELKHYPPSLPAWNDLFLGETTVQYWLHNMAPFSAGDGLRRVYELYAERFGKQRIGDKTPENVFAFHQIEQLIPEARFIHIIRDGRAVVESWRRQWFAPGGDHLGAALAWRNYVRNGRENGVRCRHYLEVWFEDLVSDPVAQLQRICVFLDLHWFPEMMEYPLRAKERLAEHGPRFDERGHETVSKAQRMQQQEAVLRAPDPAKIDLWKTRLSQAELRWIESLIGDTLVEFGYAIAQ